MWRQRRQLDLDRPIQGPIPVHGTETVPGEEPIDATSQVMTESGAAWGWSSCEGRQSQIAETSQDAAGRHCVTAWQPQILRLSGMGSRECPRPFGPPMGGVSAE